MSLFFQFDFKMFMSFMFFIVLFPLVMNSFSGMELFVVLVGTLFVLNFMSLSSYFLSFSSHISLTLSLSLWVFMISLIITSFYFLKNSIVHLTPIGTPIFLMSFMVLIELISKFIRPITLGLRLGANLTAGHLILAILSKWQFLLMVLEFLVSLVQALVFTILFVLYLEE